MITTDAGIPELARPYQGKPAGMVSRSIAGAADLLIVVGILAATYLAWVAVRFLLRPATFEMPHPSLVLILAAGFVVVVTYLTLGWTLTGQTYGDHLMGLRVVDRRGGTLHLLGALIRAILCAVCPIGLVWAAFSGRNRSVQDLLLRTSVHYDWHRRTGTRGTAPAQSP